MSEELNLEAQESSPVEAESTNEESLSANESDHGTNDSTREGDDASSKREQRADFFKRKEELEKDYQGKLQALESRKVDYQEGEEGGREVATNDPLLDTMKRDLAEVTLKQEGITHEDDIEQVLEVANSMNKSPKEIAGLTWVQAMLKDNANVRRNAVATPSSSKRSGQTSVKDSVNYWINRTDLPPKENKELRRQVIHARRDSVNKSQMFNN